MEYHNFYSIETLLNDLIDRLEDNQKIFANHLAVIEKDYPHFHYQTELYRLRRSDRIFKTS